MFGRNLFLSDKIAESRFCDFEDGIDGGRLVVGLFYIFEHVAFVFCREPPSPQPPPPPHPYFCPEVFIQVL